MPDINGQRMFFDIFSQQVFPAQCLDDGAEKALITIGKYYFFANAFKKANDILLQALASNPEWLVIDEIGKLEMQGKGFYESARKIIDSYIINYCEKGNKNLLLVVRDSLVGEMVDFFRIKNYNLIDKLED